jgi:hypothetical protein
LTIILIVLVAVATLVTAVAGFFLLRNPERGLRGILDLGQLAVIEGNAKSLVRVIVIAEHVEDPHDALLEAVKRNLALGVRYLFLVSKSHAQSELDKYFKIFQAYADVVGNSTKGGSARELVQIRQLPHNWDDAPHIFYEVRGPGDASSQFMAYRGNQIGRGIARYYTAVPACYAHTIARAILSEAPQLIDVSIDQFPRGNVTPISQASK